MFSEAKNSKTAAKNVSIKNMIMDSNVTEINGTYYCANIDGIQLLMNWKIAKHQGSL